MELKKLEELMNNKQSDWVRFTDEYCAVYFDAYDPRPSATGAVLACKLRMIKERTREFRTVSNKEAG